MKILTNGRQGEGWACGSVERWEDVSVKVENPSAFEKIFAPIPGLCDSSS